MPKISDILLSRRNYKHFTKIDLSMMFYCFELDRASQSFYVITTENGSYAYTRLPIGVKISPDVAQQHMTEILNRILDCNVYIDDIGIWTNSTFQKHVAIIDMVLGRFHKFNLKCNPLKYQWAVQETDFLGFWITPQGIKP